MITRAPTGVVTAPPFLGGLQPYKHRPAELERAAGPGRRAQPLWPTGGERLQAYFRGGAHVLHLLDLRAQRRYRQLQEPDEDLPQQHSEPNGVARGLYLSTAAEKQRQNLLATSSTKFSSKSDTF